MDALQDEVDALEAILMDDVHFGRCEKTGTVKSIETTVFPHMGENTDQHQICVTLNVYPTPGYPNESPTFELLRPRGLDDARLEVIRTACNTKIAESVGMAVVFDLIEIVREHLTESNLPSGQCVICLYGFCDGDEYTRTECFHYLHSYCLARHLNANRRAFQEEYDKLPAWLRRTADLFKATCPVCRENISDDSESLKCAMPPAELENAPEFKVTRELRELQQRMAKLYLQQKSRGAIIDVEADGATVISLETPEQARWRKQREEAETARKAEAAAKKAAAAAAAGGSTKKRNKASKAQHNDDEETAVTDDNNQQHNRRHYRGGRRHQHHLHHHHHRERERERDVGSSNGAEASAKETASAATAAVTATTNVNGKQTKAHVAGNARVR